MVNINKKIIKIKKVVQDYSKKKKYRKSYIHMLHNKVDKEGNQICNICSQPILENEMVKRTAKNIYHKRCYENE